MSAYRITRLGCAALLLAFAGPAVLPGPVFEARAAQPQVSGVEPRGLERGQTETFVLKGNRLKDAREVLVYEPGLRVTEVKPVDNRSVEVTVETDEDCRPGLHPIRLVTATGVSAMQMIAVGALPIVEEEEPNGDFDEPQEIEVGTTVSGTITSEDEDFFAVDLKAGQRLSVEVEGVRLWSGRRNDFFDPYVAILDAERFEQATSDDAPLLRQDCFCSVTAEEDGRYVVLIRDSAYGGNNGYHYRLHVGSFPRPVAVVPAGGRPGELIDATFIESDGATWTEQVQLPSLADERFPVVVERDGGVAPSPNWLRVQDLKNTLEEEPNNSLKEATAAEIPGAFCGVIGEPEDVDCFRFEASKGQKIKVALFARRTLRSPLDGVIDVYDPENKRLGGNDDSGGPDSQYEFTAGEDGEYTVRLRDHLNTGGTAYAYRIEVAPQTASLELGLPEVSRDVTVTVGVPQGGRSAVMVNATRANFGGDLELEARDLPEGVEMKSWPMPGNRTVVPVLFTASEEASLDGALIDLVGRPTAEDGPEIEGHLRVRDKLVRGQNRRDVFGYDADRAALAVTEPSPVEVEIVAPKVPIVRNGSMELPVRIVRADGFDGAVPVKLLYDPPGISSNRSIKIEEGEDEAVIPLTANGSAEIGAWPIIVVATVGTGNGAIEVASGDVDLNIEDSLFDFDFPKAMGEQGGEAKVVIELDVKREFEGEAEIELVGMPPGATLEQSTLPVTGETTELVYAVKLAEDARIGQHKTLNCKARVTSPDGVIVQTQGTGTLQVDEPLPEVEEEPKEEPEKKEPEKKAEPEEKPEKPLSRLEQLRQLREQKKEGTEE